ncbi:MAG: tRNA pseudouridine(38-40) synthase TruA [Spongiibacter sp.]|nr:tRNA pseudouridine(38-40) synthase TruA [Spongiibacter sp.]
MESSHVPEGFTRVDSTPLPAGTRIAMGIEYHGSPFRGWQSQAKPRVPTIQDALEGALSSVAAKPVTVICAGRTDAGVHASSQVVHFDAPSPRSQKAWLAGCNSLLPDEVAVKWVTAVDSEFHARFSATARRYRYLILNQPTRSAQLVKAITHCDQPLDAALMHKEAQCLLGEQDFSAFRAASCQSLSPMRNIHFIRVERFGRLVMIDIQGNAFLHHMVRNIAGVLMAVGGGQAKPGWTAEVLASKDRTQGGVTAKPHGLYLVDVSYPAAFNLPKAPIGPEFIRTFAADFAAEADEIC